MDIIMNLQYRPHLRAGAQEPRSPEVAARDGQRRPPLLPTLCARLDAGSDPQRVGFHSVHGRDERALGRVPARVRMRHSATISERFSVFPNSQETPGAIGVRP